MQENVGVQRMFSRYERMFDRFEEASKIVFEKEWRLKETQKVGDSSKVCIKTAKNRVVSLSLNYSKWSDSVNRL